MIRLKAKVSRPPPRGMRPPVKKGGQTPVAASEGGATPVPVSVVTVMSLSPGVQRAGVVPVSVVKKQPLAEELRFLKENVANMSPVRPQSLVY